MGLPLVDRLRNTTLAKKLRRGGVVNTEPQPVPALPERIGALGVIDHAAGIGPYLLTDFIYDHLYTSPLRIPGLEELSQGARDDIAAETFSPTQILLRAVDRTTLRDSQKEALSELIAAAEHLVVEGSEQIRYGDPEQATISGPIFGTEVILFRDMSSRHKDFAFEGSYTVGSTTVLLDRETTSRLFSNLYRIMKISSFPQRPGNSGGGE